MKIIVLLLTTAISAAEMATNMKKSLDDMASFYVRNSTYDDVYFNDNLSTCFEWLDDDILVGSQDNLWAEMDRYW